MIAGLYPILTEGPTLPLADFAAAARALADLGVTVLQVRVKSASDAVRLDVQRAVARTLAAPLPWPGLLVVNDRADLAAVLAAEWPELRVGLHLGQSDLPPAMARAIVGPDVAIGLSTHSLLQLAKGLAEPVDYLAFGPIFPTTTKADPDPVVGLDGLAAAVQAVRSSGLPLVAIGGLDPARAAAVAAVGADAWAVAGALFADGVAGLAARRGAFR